MATLLEKLQQNLGQVASGGPGIGTGLTTAPGGETATVERLLSARKGIVAAPGQTGPKGLAVGEIAAQVPAQQQLAQIGQAAQLQGTAMGQAAAAQKEEQSQREAAISGQRAEMALRERIQTEGILRNLEQSRTEMDEKKRQLGLELVASNLRLSDASYIDNLRREGERARLQEDISFAEKLQQSIFENNQALLKMQLKNQSLLNVSDREFNRAMADLDVNAAISAAQSNIRADSERAMIGGAASLIPAAAGVWSSQKEGNLSSGYKSYVDSVPQGERPMSYTAWSAKQPGSSQFIGPPQGGR